MDDDGLLTWRLRSQRLHGSGVEPTGARGAGGRRRVGAGFERTAAGAVAAVRRLGAVQSQDHEPALWSLAQRAPGARRADLAAAFDAGAFIRTHVLRPTWHFVASEDLRDLLALTGPRVAAGCAGRGRELELRAEGR